MGVPMTDNFSLTLLLDIKTIKANMSNTMKIALAIKASIVKPAGSCLPTTFIRGKISPITPFS